jgi:hypothetical protein
VWQQAQFAPRGKTLFDFMTAKMAGAFTYVIKFYRAEPQELRRTAAIAVPGGV